MAVKLTEKADALEEKAKKLDEDAKAEGKEALRNEARELAVKKWISEQKAAVIAERNRLVAIKKLDAARKLLNAKAPSEKKVVANKRTYHRGVCGAFPERAEITGRALPESRH